MTDTTITAMLGTFEIRTTDGTHFLLELGELGDFLTRKPGMSRPDGDEVSARHVGDFERLPLFERPDFAVGEQARVIVDVDGLLVNHQTRQVASVREM